MGKGRLIWEELKHHLPFSILSVVFGLILVGFLSFFTEMMGVVDASSHFEELFHIFHPSQTPRVAIPMDLQQYQSQGVLFLILISGMIRQIQRIQLLQVFLLIYITM